MELPSTQDAGTLEAGWDMSEPVQGQVVSEAAASGEPQFAPGEPAGKPERSEWNPLSAPATYLLLAINIGVFVWMVAHGVSVNSPSIPDPDSLRRELHRLHTAAG